MEQKEKNKTGTEYDENIETRALPVADEIPPVFVAIDNDLAVENLENDFDMTAADIQDLKERTE